MNISYVRINGSTFEMYSYFLESTDSINLRLMNTTIEAIENAVESGSGLITIGNEFNGDNFSKINYITRNYAYDIKDDEGNLIPVFVVSISRPEETNPTYSEELVDLVNQNTEDIEIANGAIEELASMIGGEEE